MASMMGGGPLDPEPLLRMLRSPRMLNKYLIAICKEMRVQYAGATKAVMQQRIADVLEKYVAEGNVARFNNLKNMLADPDALLQGRPPIGGLGGYSASPAAAALPRPIPGVHAPRYTVNGIGMMPAIEFKPSPFYTIQQQIGDTKTCEIMTAHRNNVELKIQAQDYPVLARLEFDKTLRIMAFCAGEATHLKQDISFPHQSEIKVNGGEVKANLRGLKNKPGSTRPVDITTYLRLKPPTYPNRVEITYALTTKKYYFKIYLVKVMPVEELRKTIENGKKLSKESVMSEMATKAADPDIVTTSTVLSLKCPLSTLRMDLPVRSTSCRHNQCFDATSYLQLQEQGPTWLCPICNNPAPFESLAVDNYVRDILTNTSKSQDQVTIEPDGKWHTNIKPPTPSNASGNFGNDTDDDIIEIKDARVASVMNQSTPGTSASTPPTSAYSREPSASSSVPRPSNKRRISAVIDLTLSDEDEEPIRPAKRQSMATPTINTPQPPYYQTPPNPNFSA